MSSPSDYMVVMLIMLVVLLFGGNFLYEKLVTNFIKEKMGWINYVGTAIAMPIFFCCGVLFVMGVNGIIIYEPPKPISLIFWGIDKSEFGDYVELNDMIKVTNSRVVLFGDAVDDPLPIKNIIGSIPVTPVDNYRSVRIWYDFNRDDPRKWHGVAVFGEDKVGHKEWFHYADEASMAYAKQQLENGDKGIFENKIPKGMLCDLTTTKSTKSSGRRPSENPSKIFPGL